MTALGPVLVEWAIGGLPSSVCALRPTAEAAVREESTDGPLESRLVAPGSRSAHFLRALALAAIFALSSLVCLLIGARSVHASWMLPAARFSRLN